jgi:hypothetical protein
MSSSSIPSTLDARTQAFPVLTPAQISRVRITMNWFRQGLFAPVTEEVTAFDLPVTGRIRLCEGSNQADKFQSMPSHGRSSF